MAKKFENMTQDERTAYWEKQRADELKMRRQQVDKVPAELLAHVQKLHELASDVAHDALYNGGVRYLSCDQLQQLEHAADTVSREFCLGD